MTRGSASPRLAVNASRRTQASSASQAGLAFDGARRRRCQESDMNPTSLINLSPEALRERARHGMSACLAAGPVERVWGAVACFILLASAVLVMVGLR
jgi:hypothetical protein